MFTAQWQSVNSFNMAVIGFFFLLLLMHGSLNIGILVNIWNFWYCNSFWKSNRIMKHIMFICDLALLFLLSFGESLEFRGAVKGSF